MMYALTRAAGVANSSPLHARIQRCPRALPDLQQYPCSYATH